MAGGCVAEWRRAANAYMLRENRTHYIERPGRQLFCRFPYDCFGSTTYTHTQPTEGWIDDTLTR